jgi:hypothetical protein
MTRVKACASCIKRIKFNNKKAALARAAKVATA